MIVAERMGAGLDVAALRRDFPLLQRQINGKQLVYLDSAATSQKPEAVIAALVDHYRHYNANVHRGAYTLAEEATAHYDQARRKVAAFINARRPREVVFVRNATEAINLVAYTWGRANVGAGDVIVLTEMEHHANLVPWQRLAQEKGAQLAFVRIDAAGRLRLEDLERHLSARTRLVALTHVSNVLGTVNPVRDVVARAHQVGARVLVDGAQSVPHLPVDVADLGCDFLAFSGHKMMGPTGVGVLWGREDLLKAMDPFLAGGDMIKQVEWHQATWNDLPWKFEAGTPAIAEAVALGAAVDYLAALGMARVWAHEQEMAHYALERLAAVPGLRFFGPPAAERAGVIAFTVDGIHPHDLATLLDREGIAIRAGHHCAEPLHHRLGLEATARASFYVYNEPAEVDRLVEALEKAKRVFEV